MSGMTKTIDEGTCPKCQKRFDAAKAINYDISRTIFVHCPHCNAYLEVFASVEYQIQEVDENGEPLE